MDKIYSWTQVSLAQECGQKFKWRYDQGIKERNSADSRPMILGSAVHKGIETYLRLKSERPSLTHEGRLILASDAARAYVKKDTKPHQQKWDYATKSQMFDSDYYTMMREVEEAAVVLLMHYTPRIPGEWRIATKAEVLGDDRYAGTPALGNQLALEWEIHHTLPGGQKFKGIVDAVIYDTRTNEILLVDWKVKSKFPYDDMASLDGQLHLYAAVLNLYGASIKTVCMFQMLSTPPAAAKPGAGKNTGTILTGQETYASTWEYWVSTLPMGHKPETYEALMKPKMKDWGYFIRPVTSPVTRHSSAFALDNLRLGIEMIEAEHLPARLSTYTCQSCAYAPLCDAKRYGTDIDYIVASRFDKNK